MAQRKQLTWTELRVGLFVLAGIVLVVVGVLFVTGTGALGPKYRVMTFLPEVDGLAIGAPVSINGVEVGNVDSITIAPSRGNQPPVPDRSVEVVMRINRNFRDYIRTDSYATLLTEGFLGNRVVSIQRGYTGQVLGDGQELPGKEERAMKEVVERGADLMQNLSALSSQVGQMVSGLQKGQGTLGKLLTDETAYNRINNVLGRVDQLTASVQQGQGTIGKLVLSDELYTKFDSAAGRIDNVMNAIEEQKGSLGKFIYDPSVHESARQFLNDGNALLSDVRAGRGTLGKLATDDTLFATWRQTGQNLKDATANLNSPGSTAGKFFSDPQFYDNMSGVAGDLRLLLNEFREDPKKYLKVKFSLF
jgi:phospholipid/cholesterol/gamma-HCH transport system substrate-binding protein